MSGIDEVIMNELIDISQKSAFLLGKVCGHLVALEGRFNQEYEFEAAGEIKEVLAWLSPELQALYYNEVENEVS